MALSIWFWVFYVLSIVFGGWGFYNPAEPTWYRRFGGYAILWILVGILGYQVFGSVVK